MHNSRSNFLPICCHAYRKTVNTIVLIFLLGIHILLKVDRFEGFVNQSNITNFIASKTSRCNFQLESFKETLMWSMQVYDPDDPLSHWFRLGDPYDQYSLI